MVLAAAAVVVGRSRLFLFPASRPEHPRRLYPSARGARGALHQAATAVMAALLGLIKVSIVHPLTPQMARKQKGVMGGLTTEPAVTVVTPQKATPYTMVVMAARLLLLLVVVARVVVLPVKILLSVVMVALPRMLTTAAAAAVAVLGALAPRLQASRVPMVA
jgi:hypothetical protein